MVKKSFVYNIFSTREVKNCGNYLFICGKLHNGMVGVRGCLLGLVSLPEFMETAEFLAPGNALMFQKKMRHQRLLFGICLSFSSCEHLPCNHKPLERPELCEHMLYYPKPMANAI